MRSTTGTLRTLLWLALLLALPGLPACVASGAHGRSFDIPAQPAASALNEFARQADITLIFSYDLVAGKSTHRLKGGFSVDEGLNRLLAGTSLDYRQATDGTYLICAPASCGHAVSAKSGAMHRQDHVGGGNPSTPRLQDKTAPTPDI